MSPSFFAKKRNQIIQEEIDKIQAEIDKEELRLKQLRDELEAAEAASPGRRRTERYNRLQASYGPVIREFLADGEFHNVEEIKKTPELADLDDSDFYHTISWLRAWKFIERDKENGNMIRSTERWINGGHTH